MSTMAGSTLAAIALASSALVLGVVGRIGASAPGVTVWATPAGGWMARARLQPIPAPDAAAITAATTTPAASRGRRGAGRLPPRGIPPAASRCQRVFEGGTGGGCGAHEGTEEDMAGDS